MFLNYSFISTSVVKISHSDGDNVTKWHGPTPLEFTFHRLFPRSEWNTKKARAITIAMSLKQVASEAWKYCHKTNWKCRPVYFANNSHLQFTIFFLCHTNISSSKFIVNLPGWFFLEWINAKNVLIFITSTFYAENCNFRLLCHDC